MRKNVQLKFFECFKIWAITLVDLKFKNMYKKNIQLKKEGQVYNDYVDICMYISVSNLYIYVIQC